MYRDPETETGWLDGEIELPSMSAVRAFVATAQSGSLRGAAADLNTTPEAVRRAVDRLERHTEMRLFDRDRSGVRLTKTGRALLPTAQRILYLAAETMGRRSQLARYW